MIHPFSLSQIPATYAGAHAYKKIIPEVKKRGLHHVLIMGESSFKNSPYRQELEKAFGNNQLSTSTYFVKNEPSPKDIDDIVRDNTSLKPGSVIAIGGGSVIDAGKAVSAMISLNEPVKDYLEGVGTKTHPGVKIPFIAVPTTAGTGSEATKNAVISEVGPEGFKKSLRHNAFVPDLAILDPLLHISCPPSVTSASGMDAITQLIESFVSTRANIFTDSLCIKALKVAFKALPVVIDEPKNLEARLDMAYAAFISGITLANAGLGTVHGFASSIGGKFDIPHGVICGTLLAETTKYTLEQLLEENPDHPSVKKYKKLGELMNNSLNVTNPLDKLLDGLFHWTNSYNIPKLGNYGFKEEHIQPIIEKTGQKNNPVELNRERLSNILKHRM